MSGCIPEALKTFFSENPRIAIAFSGGTDSSYLLYAAKECNADFRAYSVESAFRSPVERANAARISTLLGIPVTIIDADPLSSEAVSANAADRCYQCKIIVFSLISERASNDGCRCIIDACNASDDPALRPGMKALEEMGILSPLRMAGLSKADIRRLSEKAGLPTWNVPSDSCLATRIATGRTITAAELDKVAKTETALRNLGLSGIRVRIASDIGATLEIPESQRPTFDDNNDLIASIMVSSFGTFTVKERIAPRED